MKMDSVMVSVRIRPMDVMETNSGCRQCIEKIENEPQLILGHTSPQAFRFDHVFGENHGQAAVYNQAVQPMLVKLFKGYNVTILAYGQTGTGKTYTMGTNYSGSGELGVIPRAVIDIFQYIHDNQESTDFKISVSFLELYNEVLYDLLTSKNRDQSVVELRDSGNSICIPGLSMKSVSSADETLNVLSEGSLLRVTGATAMNASSSRSHAVFTINIRACKKNSSSSNESVVSKFHLVDLAGSERAKKTGAVGDRFKEGVNINKGLMVLGNVISQLGDGTSTFINYRDSKLTRLLQDSLGGNSYTMMIACVSPADTNREESLCTLRYADRVKKIKNRPVINMDPQAALISQLRQENESLRLQVIAAGVDGKKINSDKMLEDKILEETRKSAELSNALKSALHQNAVVFERSIMLECLVDKTKSRLSDLQSELNGIKSSDNTEPMEKLKTTVANILTEFLAAEKDIFKHSKEDSNRLASDPCESSEDQYMFAQVKTHSQIEEITKNLMLKQELYETITQNSSYYDEMNKLDLSMQELKNQVNQLENESVMVQKKIQAAALKRKLTPSSNHGSDELQIKYDNLQKELKRANQRLQEQEKLLKLKDKTKVQIINLRKEIQNLKSMRVQLLQEIKSGNDRFRSCLAEKNKEVMHLKSLNTKQISKMVKMEKEFSTRQAVWRRKLEAAAAIKKRMERAVHRTITSGPTKKQTSLEPGQIADFLTAEIDIFDSSIHAKRALLCLVGARTNLTQELSDVERELENGCLTKEHTDYLLERKKALVEELDLHSAQISDLQVHISEVKQDERMKHRWDRISSILEAKLALGYLFSTIMELKKETLSKTDKISDLEKCICDKDIEIKDLIKKMEESEYQYSKELDILVNEYECQIAEFFKGRIFPDSEKEGTQRDGVRKKCMPDFQVTSCDECVKKVTELSRNLCLKCNEDIRKVFEIKDVDLSDRLYFTASFNSSRNIPKEKPVYERSLDYESFLEKREKTLQLSGNEDALITPAATPLKSNDEKHENKENNNSAISPQENNILSTNIDNGVHGLLDLKFQKQKQNCVFSDIHSIFTSPPENGDAREVLFSADASMKKRKYPDIEESPDSVSKRCNIEDKLSEKN